MISSCVIFISGRRDCTLFNISQHKRSSIDKQRETQKIESIRHLLWCHLRHFSSVIANIKDMKFFIEFIFVCMKSVCLNAVNLFSSILYNNFRIMTLFSLSREICYFIYQHVLCVLDYLCSNWKKHRFFFFWQESYSSITLLITCRAIREEILKILYNWNRWLFTSRARFNAELSSF